MERIQRMLSPLETPRESMEFLSRSWSVSAPIPPRINARECNGISGAILDEYPSDVELHACAPLTLSGGPPFPFASSQTSQLVFEHIMPQSQESTPRPSRRPSYSSFEHVTYGPSWDGSFSRSPQVSPSPIDDPKNRRLNDRIMGRYKSFGGGDEGGKIVSRWLKQRKERRKEEMRMQNAQLHAAVSVAGVAAAVAYIAVAAASSLGDVGCDKQMAKTDMTVASAATLVAAQCIEAAEAMGAERRRLASVVSSAVNVRSADDIMTLTDAAATALRGVATLKARTCKKTWNMEAVLPVDRGLRVDPSSNNDRISGSSTDSFHELIHQDYSLGIEHSREFLARGCVLLKRTRTGVLHWKLVSVYIDTIGNVMLNMKSRHVVGAVAKRKKNVVLEVVRDVVAWTGREAALEKGEKRRYFGLKTVARGIIEFECRNTREYDAWTEGVSRLLKFAAQRK